MSTNSRIKDISKTTTAPASDAYVAFDGATNGTQRGLWSTIIANIASIFKATPSTYGLCPLNGSNQVDSTYLPTGPLNVKGDWDASTNTPTLADGTGTECDAYDVNVAGTVNLGSGNITFNIGDRVVYNDANDWYRRAKGSNLFDGTSTQAGAATAGGYLLSSEVQDRIVNRAPNALRLGNNGYVSQSEAAPGTASLQDNFTILVDVVFTALPASDTIFAILSGGSTAASASNGSMEITSGGAVNFDHYDGGFDDLNNVVSSVTLGQGYSLGYKQESSGDGLTGYANGVKGSSVASGAGTNSTLRFNLGISDGNNSGTNIVSAAVYNFALSDAQITARAKDGRVPYEHQNAGGTQTSGTLEVGRAYRIETFVAGDDFTNVGAGSNVTGIEFVATGTTPTTYSNGSTLTRIGCIQEYRPENILPDGSWTDSTTNNRLGAGTTAEPLVRPSRGQYVVEKEYAHGDISSSSGTTKVADLPAGCRFVGVETVPSTAFDASTDLDFGTSLSQTKFITSVGVASTARIYTASDEASISDTATTPVYVTKNQATTQGQITIRIVYEVVSPSA